MIEHQLRDAVEDVRRGKLSRRAFTLRMIGLGLTAPLAAQMLTSSGVALADDKPVYKPTKRGGGGALKVLWWQGPTLLNPHFAVGTKDQDGSRLFYEPLASWDPEGNLNPILAAGDLGGQFGNQVAVVVPDGERFIEQIRAVLVLGADGEVRIE